MQSLVLDFALGPKKPRVFFRPSHPLYIRLHVLTPLLTAFLRQKRLSFPISAKQA
jgi:hypothetical protein